MTTTNDRIFVSTSYMDGSAAISWAAADNGILSPSDKDAYSGELLVHMDGRATIKWWDGASPDEEPFVLVIDPKRANGSYVTIHKSEDQPPDEDAPVAWKFGEPDVAHGPFEYHGWEVGEDVTPPEPGKEWLAIVDGDGEEIAVIVLRTDASIFANDPAALEAARREREQNATEIVAALNRASA